MVSVGRIELHVQRFQPTAVLGSGHSTTELLPLVLFAWLLQARFRHTITQSRLKSDRL